MAAYNSIPNAVPDPDYDATLRRVGDRAASVPVLVAESDDSGVCGTLTYVPGPGPYADLAAAGEAEIRMFAVAPGMQGRGVGGALLDAAIGTAVREHRSALVLSTSPWMVDAVRLYRSRGFERDESLDWSERSSGTIFELLGYRRAVP